MSAISVRGLRKSYGEQEAVRGISFHIKEGEVFGLLGPKEPLIQITLPTARSCRY